MDLIESSDTHLSISQDRPRLAREVTARLEEDPDSWLLILDNADDFDLFVGTAGRENAISSYVPREGRVLITTRNSRFQGTVAAATDGLHVKPMDTSEAKDLLMKSIPPDLTSQSSPAILDELLGLLGNLPLALAQAAANIADQHRPVQEYIAAYRDRRNRPSLMQEPVLDYETQQSRISRQSLLVTYEISFEDLEREHQLSARCLNYFGFFHWQKIPEYCIRALPGLKELDDQSFRDTIKHLLHLSLIEESSYHDRSEYSVHPVIHERISDRLSLEEKRSNLSDSVAVMMSKFPRIRKTKEREYFASCRHLQSHALLQINFATEIHLKSSELARLNRCCAEFLRRSGMTFDSVQLAAQAVAMIQETSGPHSSSAIRAYIEKMACLNYDAQYREAYKQSKFAVEALVSAELDNEHDLVLRGDILNQSLKACRGLGKYKEAEEIANELMVMSTELQEDTDANLHDRFNFAVTLRKQKRYLEAQKINNELLDSMTYQQRTSHRLIYLRAYSLTASILSDMREGSDTEPSFILNNEEEKSILRTFQEVFDEYSANFPITDRDLWKGCNNLLGELEHTGKAPEAAEVLVSMLTKAVEAKLRLEGRTIPTFRKTLRYGLNVMELLHGTRDARQGPPGLPIANLLIQTIALAGTTTKRLWHDSPTLRKFADVFMSLGDWRKAEELLLGALQDVSLEEDRSIEGRIHYDLMLAIARQGRIDDARRYRDDHLALIFPEESKIGDFDERLQRDRETKETYDKAKSIIAGRDRKVSEKWWRENRKVLNRAQLRYGLLVSATAEEDPGPYQNTSEAAVTKQKGKTRGLGGLIDKLHISPHSSSHP